MHLFPSPYNTGSQACERLGENRGARFSTFVLVSALLHLLVMGSFIGWRQDTPKHFTAGDAVIEIDLVSIPGRKMSTPAPEPLNTLKEEKPVQAPSPEIPEIPAAENQTTIADPIVKKKTPTSAATEKHAEAPTPHEKKITKPVKTSPQPVSPASVVDIPDKTGRPEHAPSNAMASRPESSQGDAGANAAAVQNAATAPRKKQGLPGKGSPGQRYLDENFYYVKDLITRNLTYPVVARRMKWQGTVVVSFVVLEDGKAENIRVVTSSGHSLLDKNVIATIEQVQPFPPPPAAAEFTMPIKYTLRP